MRTTVDLPDGLTRRAKLAAVRAGVSFKALVAKALEQHLDQAAVKPTGGPLQFPLVPSHQAGSLKLSPDEVQQILVREEAAAYEAAQRR
jgi:hypothetical protein